jgi:hypothetical protein
MPDKDDLCRIALALPGVTVSAKDDYAFDRDGRGMIWPYPEKVHPKKARVPNYSMYCMRIADADDKEALLAGEPEVFFTTDHYNGYAAVIVRLDAVDEDRLREIVQMAWDAAPTSQRLSRKV